MPKYAEQYHIKLVTMPDILNTDYGKIPYSKCVGVGYCKAYYAEDIVYTCAEKPANWITPCKVRPEHTIAPCVRNPMSFSYTRVFLNTCVYRKEYHNAY